MRTASRTVELIRALPAGVHDPTLRREQRCTCLSVGTGWRSSRGHRFVASLDPRLAGLDDFLLGAVRVGWEAMSAHVYGIRRRTR